MISPIISPVTYFLVSEQLPPGKNCPLSGLRFESRLGLVFGLGVNETIIPKENIPLLGLGFGLGLVLRLGSNCPRTTNNLYITD